jgi:hypothetical protein
MNKQKMQPPQTDFRRNSDEDEPAVFVPSDPNGESTFPVGQETPYADDARFFCEAHFLEKTVRELLVRFPMFLMWAHSDCAATAESDGSTERQVKVKVTLRPTVVGQSVLVSGAHLGPATNFSFSLRFSLDSCGFVIL